MAPESENNLRLEIGHVLFIDLVGYSKLLIEEQKKRLRQLTDIVLASAQVRESTDEQLVRLPTGDGMALVFRRSAEEPARCALEIAQALKAHPDIPTRMGVHSGPVSNVTDLNSRTNIAGAGINMAQRVMDCGDAGHILLSKHVADDLEQYGHWQPQLHDLGACEVKHGLRLGVVNLYADGVGNPQVPRKIRVCRQRKRIVRAVVATALLLLAAISIAVVVFLRKPKQLAAPEKSIAVLPFANLSSDKENAYFAEGIQDEILTRLSKIADLKVISRTSTLHYKSAPENLSEIGRQLGVAHLLEGSVQKSGDAVRINVQLIKAADDSHLWADIFDRKLTDIFAVESEVSKAIAEKLRAKLTGAEEQVIAAKPTDNVEAYDAYLRGLAYSLRSNNSPANSLGAQTYLKEAVRLDPKFALAWALLSYVESKGYLGTLPSTAALREDARAAAETALTLQPNLGDAVLAKGYYHYACLKEYDTAVRYFEQARELLPNSSRIPESLAYVERRRGQWEQSETYFAEAERLDPRNVALLSQHAISYVYLRRFSDAVRKLDQVLNVTPDNPDTVAFKGIIAQAEGDLPRAAALLAPLHPTAADTGTVEAQVYQAILEGQPAEIIPRMKDVLAKAGSDLGYYKGELRFWLGWALDVAGDHTAAQETWRQARDELEPVLQEQPENYVLLGDLALIHAVLGDKATAFALVERDLAAMPLSKDALAGGHPIEILARVAALTGEPARALAALEKLLSIPYDGVMNVPLTPALLRLDPMFHSLRTDQRFQKRCEEKQPGAGE